MAIIADDVTIDLNGFAIIGSAGGVGNGISSSNSEVTVRNGSITGMGGNGIVLGNNATVADVLAIGNGGNGIEIGNAGLVTHSTVSSNVGVGIFVTGSGSAVVENSVYSNGSYGLQLEDISSSFARNVFLGNKGNSRIGSLVPPQVAPASSGIQFQMGSNVCNGDACP